VTAETGFVKPYLRLRDTSEGRFTEGIERLCRQFPDIQILVFPQTRTTPDLREKTPLRNRTSENQPLSLFDFPQSDAIV
jgi:hypothetical protein